jgi:hypothetical protein
MKSGGFCEPTGKLTKYMILIPNFMPRGCVKEIRKWELCAKARGEEACLNEKISIMEVCPDHVLEGMREKKKWSLRAEVIDNETYKRAMRVGEYNRGKSVTDLQLKTWAHGKGGNLRSDSLWEDDRYDPSKVSHPHRYDNFNFPEQEYKDVFGGTIGDAARKEQAQHKIGLLSGQSKAMVEAKKEAKAARPAGNPLRSVVEEVKAASEAAEAAAEPTKEE